jgi:GMP synthase (glutamine-hydrolysing)
MDDIYPRELERAWRLVLDGKNVQICTLNYKDSSIIKKIKSCAPLAIILSGSNYRILDVGSPTLPSEVLRLNIPILGICYGFQWLIKQTKGGICTHDDKELHQYGKLLTIYGKRNIYRFKHHDFICDLDEKKWRGQIYDDTGVQIWMATHKTLPLTGIQFHPEKKDASAKTFFSNWLAENMK